MLERIAIHSVPRSGSSWLGQLFNSHPKVAFRFQPLFSYAFKGRLTEYSSLEEINAFFDDILNTTDDFILQKNESKISDEYPIFSKDSELTHIVYKEVRYHYILSNLLSKDKKIKIIGLVRSPFSVINSWINAPKEFRKDLGWKVLEEWLFAKKKNLARKEEYNGYLKWKEVALLFLKLSRKYPDRFKIIKYSEMIENTVNIVNQIFEFCGIDMHENTLRFIEKSKTINGKDPYGVFKKKILDDNWKKELNSIIIKEIKKDIINSDLKIFL